MVTESKDSGQLVPSEIQLHLSPGVLHSGHGVYPTSTPRLGASLANPYEMPTSSRGCEDKLRQWT